MIGHRHGVTHHKQSHSAAEEHDHDIGFLLEEATVKYQEMKVEAESRPDRPDLQANLVIQWAWLCEFKPALSEYKHYACIPRGFVAALNMDHKQHRNGSERETRQAAPTLKVETQEPAQALKEFRMQVSMLGVHSSTHEEERAQNEVANIRSRYANYIRAHVCTPAQKHHNNSPHNLA